MALSDELSAKVLAYIIGGATITTTGTVYGGLMRNGGITNLTTDAAFLTNEIQTADYSGYTRTSTLTTGVFGAYSAGTNSGSLQNSASAITWPTKVGGSVVQVRGVFLVSTSSGAGEFRRWTTTFTPVDVAAGQQPRIPVNGCIITER